MRDDTLRVPPYSIDAEQAVLGGIMLDNSAYLAVADLLHANDFHCFDHQLIFQAIKTMAADNQPLDVVTVSDWAKGRLVNPQYPADKRTFFDVIGGLAYLGTLAKDTPSSANIRSYANIVRNYSLKRQLIALCSKSIDQAFDTTSDDQSVADLLESTASGIFKLEQQKEAAKQGFMPMKQGIETQLKRLDKLKDNDGTQCLGASSQLEALDKQLSGFENGKVYVIAGRPAMGKTTLGLNLVEGIATSTQGVVAVFSLEMTCTQIMEKMMSSQGEVNFSRLRSPWELSVSDWDNVAEGVKKLRHMDVFFDDQSTQSPADLRIRCRRLVRETGKPLAGIMIDYVQLMHGSAKSYINREAEVSAISGEIRALAKDFDCPVLLLSQLNRSVETRPNKRPVMSDLRESGALEQDASCVIFIYRDEVYNANSPDKGIAELIVAKHRGGQIGTSYCAFVGKHQRFANHQVQGKQ